MAKEKYTNWFKGLQDNICAALENADGKAKFEEDLWERPGGGGGRTRIMRNGQVIEKGGVNFSSVFGRTPQALQDKMGFPPSDFYATGVSIVLHPANPMVPIIHMNVRYFELSTGTAWFGGGIDLTPIYIVPQQAQFFHEQLKQVCDQHHTDYYTEFKQWADNYFYIPHRNETRGVGGIFFDRLQATDDISLEDRFAFVQSVGNAFAPIYTYLIGENRNKSFDEKHKEWQRVRRGRYVEFNLVYDKGTKFGLETSGRIESILMSLPAHASWVYNYQAQPGSEEEKTMNLLKKDIDWVQ
ncbi:oxygen-dependent coproporphyrinogen oxidase [uncultured Microscilla sp.]|uniref:oxygen-dependent coproporphyrinogen oxidase n=1 Tax=uncultured Microscilla sp. TaxID=432653 RepID=UPI00261CA1E7|nr:oxygen-dependent coproporphyrinogen oxidase [uncultured Microscilla sp.]